MINWVFKTFDELTAAELYAIIQLREDIFIVEQNCPFLDCDGKDPNCWHLMGWEDGKLAAYSRIVPPGVAFETASIGRVVTSREARRHGFGKLLMQKAIEKAEELGFNELTIGAQYYLLGFYQSFGFIEFDEIYLEDGIEHIYMRREKLEPKD
ncbi:GNAT family N-acetyltransferase [Solitalea longa]|uniref:GNAT family N-acetyltransferase n=1 Tax=Solitalea longa TaxID=2079460 RepID=A0A2S4ZX42_9SPHI|nr:GNAT family N-acetyltransferase [Solitalea longa]POY34875.1 GNAT family N-acetyltransferase [Solitalea longa]